MTMIDRERERESAEKHVKSAKKSYLKIHVPRKKSISTSCFVNVMGTHAFTVIHMHFNRC